MTRSGNRLNLEEFGYMKLDDLTYAVRGCVFEVFKELGPGLLESVYVASLAHELSIHGLKVRCQVGLPVTYKETSLDLGFRIALGPGLLAYVE